MSNFSKIYATKYITARSEEVATVTKKKLADRYALTEAEAITFLNTNAHHYQLDASRLFRVLCTSCAPTFIQHPFNGRIYFIDDLKKFIKARAERRKCRRKPPKPMPIKVRKKKAKKVKPTKLKYKQENQNDK